MPSKLVTKKLKGSRSSPPVVLAASVLFDAPPPEVETVEASLLALLVPPAPMAPVVPVPDVVVAAVDAVEPVPVVIVAPVTLVAVLPVGVPTVEVDVLVALVAPPALGLAAPLVSEPGSSEEEHAEHCKRESTTALRSK